MLSRLFSARSCIPVRHYRPIFLQFDDIDDFVLSSTQRGRVGLSFGPNPVGPVDNEFIVGPMIKKAATLCVG